MRFICIYSVYVEKMWTLTKKTAITENEGDKELNSRWESSAKGNISQQSRFRANHRNSLRLPIRSDDALIHPRRHPACLPGERMLARRKLTRKYPRYLCAEEIHDRHIRIAFIWRREG